MKYVITQLNNYIITYLYIFGLQLIEPVLILFDIGHDNGSCQRPQRNVTTRIDANKLQFLLDLFGQPDGDALLVDAGVPGEVLLEGLLAAATWLTRFLRRFRDFVCILGYGLCVVSGSGYTANNVMFFIPFYFLYNNCICIFLFCQEFIFGFYNSKRI